MFSGIRLCPALRFKRSSFEEKHIWLGYSTASRPIESRGPQLTTAITAESRSTEFAKADFCIDPWIRAGADGGTKDVFVLIGLVGHAG